MIYVSSSCVKANSIKEAITTLVQEGFRNIELSGGTKYYDDLIEDLLVLKEQKDLNYLVHNYFPPPEQDFVLNLASQDESILRKSISFVKRSIDLTKMIGNRHYSIHPGYSTDLKLDICGEHFVKVHNRNVKPNKIAEQLIRSFSEVLEYAEYNNVQIAIENLFPSNSKDNFSLCCTPEEIGWFFDSFKSSSNLNLLLDVGHAKITANLIGMNLKVFLDKIIKSYREYISEIHFSDNDGIEDLHEISEASQWMTEFICENSLSACPIVIEARHSSIEEIKKMYNYSVSLLEKENVR